ncbi:hypothetical protein [Nostoc sp. ATCC 53789]|nr:hypothetical protein [Nostoc sp. ATCC 53789]
MPKVTAKHFSNNLLVSPQKLLEALEVLQERSLGLLFIPET